MGSVLLLPTIGIRPVEMVSALSGNVIEIGAPPAAQAIKMAQVVQGPAGPVGPAGPPGSGGAAAFPEGVTVGGPVVFTATLGLTSLASPVIVLLTFNVAPAAGATLNADGLGAVPIKTHAGNAIAGGEIAPNLIGFWRISATGAHPMNMG